MPYQILYECVSTQPHQTTGLIMIYSWSQDDTAVVPPWKMGRQHIYLFKSQFHQYGHTYYQISFVCWQLEYKAGEVDSRSYSPSFSPDAVLLWFYQLGNNVMCMHTADHKNTWPQQYLPTLSLFLIDSGPDKNAYFIRIFEFICDRCLVSK